MPKLSHFNKYNVGDLVEFITKEFQVGLSETKITKGNITTVYREGQNKMFPPSMVVLEVVKEDVGKTHLRNEQTGEKIKDPVKILCQWYSDRTGKFFTRWFNVGVLKKSKTKLKIIPRDDFKINSLVTLKTFELAKKTTQKIFKNAVEEQSGNISYTVTKKYDTLSFLPPMMYVTDIVDLKESEKKPVYRKTGAKEKMRKTSAYKVKCMWYNHITGKFSEDYFFPETLTEPKVLTDTEKFG